MNFVTKKGQTKIGVSIIGELGIGNIQSLTHTYPQALMRSAACRKLLQSAEVIRGWRLLWVLFCWFPGIPFAMPAS